MINSVVGFGFGFWTELGSVGAVGTGSNGKKWKRTENGGIGWKEQRLFERRREADGQGLRAALTENTSCIGYYLIGGRQKNLYGHWHHCGF